MAFGATLSERKFILLWERHLAAILSWLEATPTQKKAQLTWKFQVLRKEFLTRKT